MEVPRDKYNPHLRGCPTITGTNDNNVLPYQIIPFNFQPVNGRLPVKHTTNKGFVAKKLGTLTAMTQTLYIHWMYVGFMVGRALRLDVANPLGVSVKCYRPTSFEIDKPISGKNMYHVRQVLVGIIASTHAPAPSKNVTVRKTNCQKKKIQMRKIFKSISTICIYNHTLLTTTFFNKSYPIYND